MSTLKNTLIECLNESSLSRILHHTMHNNIAILTAHRGNLSSAENNARNDELKKKIREAGYGYIRVKGHYIEGYGSDLAKDVNEHAFIVVGDGKDDADKLLNHVKQWGELYNQDSVLHKKHDTKKAVLYGTSKNEESYPRYGFSVDVGTYHPSRMGEFHSSLNKNKSFVFESVNESHYSYILEEDRYWNARERASQLYFSIK